MSENSKRLSITDIESKQFRRVAYGYEQQEVDEFLDSVCDEMELLQGEMEELTRQLDYARAEVRKVQAASGFVTPAAATPDASFREILEMAQRVKDQTIADAQKKAEEIVADAQATAEAELGSLEEERDRLEETIRELRAQAHEYHDAVAELLRTHQEALEQINLDD